MSAITLRKALGVLAKSSSFSVTTETHRQKDVFDELKNNSLLNKKSKKSYSVIWIQRLPVRSFFYAEVAEMGNPKF